MDTEKSELALDKLDQAAGGVDSDTVFLLAAGAVPFLGVAIATGVIIGRAGRAARAAFE